MGWGGEVSLSSSPTCFIYSYLLCANVSILTYQNSTLPPPRRFNPTATPFAPSPSALANPYSTSPNPALEAPEMGRSGSGGVRIGRRVIGFGDSEAVDLETARERAERGRQMIEREESGLEGLGLGLGR